MKMNHLVLVDLHADNKWNPIEITFPCQIGTKSSNSLVLPYRGVSGQHAQIRQQDDVFVIEDLKSTNGTKVNGQKINQSPLQDGDELAIGSAKFLVKVTEQYPPRLCALEEKRCYLLAKLPFHIGRNQNSNELAINAHSVSGKHALIREEKGEYYLVDCNSTNGTRVNNQNVSEKKLEHLDLIKIGNWKGFFVCQKQPDPENFSLRFLSGERVGEEVALGNEVTLGRGKDNSVVIDFHEVSTHHAQINFWQGHYWIEDLESRNGTKVNGVRITRTILQPEDEITLGRQFSLLVKNPNLVGERHYLVFTEGVRGGEEMILPPSTITIGRKNSCDIVLAINEVSGQHTEIRWENGQYVIQDLGSTNGTHVNGHKITSHFLQHGDEIQIGEQKFIFRSSEQKRPEKIKEESFSLVPLLRKRYGSPVEVTDNFVIGSSSQAGLTLRGKGIGAEHAIVQKVRGGYRIHNKSSLGTRVNDELIQSKELEHGDTISIGRHRLVVKSNLRPLERFFNMGYQLSIPLVAASLFLALCLYMMVSSLLQDSSSLPVSSSAEKTVKDNKEQQPQKILSDEAILAQARQQIDEYLKKYAYDKASAEVEKTRQRLNLLSNKNKLSQELAQIKNQQQVFHEINVLILRNPHLNITIEVPGKGECYVRNSNLQMYTLMLETEDRQIFTQVWEQLPPQALFTIARKLPLANHSYLPLARMAQLHGLEKECEHWLVRAVREFPEHQQLVNQIYAKLTNQKIPPGGFLEYQGELLPAAEAKEKIAAAKRQAERLEKKNRQIALERKRKLAKELAREREQEEFPLRFAMIEEFVRTYSYQKAKEEFRKLEEDLLSPELKEKVRKRIKEIEPQAQLFQSLITSINDNTLIDNKVKLSQDFTGQLTKATQEYFKIEFSQGAIREKWYHLSPQQIYDFFERMAVGQSQLFQIGVFCFENNLIDEGNQRFIEFLRKYPASHERVDQYLAKKFNIPIPEGGFVPYRQKLVTPEERKYRQQGLVRYEDEWVTPAEKKKFEAGYQQHNGKWVTREEKELLAKGYQKYQGKWYSQQELAKIRQQWEHAWTVTTDHYEIRSNVSEEFTHELAAILEAAYPEYAKFFEKEVTERSTMYAFRNFEDYRKFCIDSGNPDLVRAGGFASRLENRAVGWRRANDKDLLNTMLHEGAHLYQYKAYPNTTAPSWLAEGIATQFEGYTWNSKTQTLTMDHKAKRRLSWVKRQFLKNDYFSIEELIQGNALELINNDPQDALTFYAQCWALYHYLLYAPDEKLRDQFQKFLGDVHLGNFMGQEAERFNHYLGPNLDKLEENWKQYIISLN